MFSENDTEPTFSGPRGRAPGSRIYHHDDLHAVFERGDDVAVVHRHSLQKIYLPRAEWEADKASVIARFRPYELVKPPTTPRILQAVLTQACNYRCSYCTVFNNPQPAANKTMTLEVVDKVIETWNEKVTAKNGLLILHGGEPLMNWKGLTRLVEGIDANTVMFTNGSLLDKEKARWLAAHDVNVLVSMDGLPEVHDRTRRDVVGRATSERTLQGYWNAVEAGCVTGVSLVMGAHNWHRLVDTVEEVLDLLEPASLGVNLPHFAENYTNCELNIDRYAQDMVRLFRLARRRQFYLYPITKFVKHIVQERFKWFDCSAMGEKLVVFPDGSASNCINYTANASGTELLDIWQHELPVYNPICRGCHALGICGGGCIYDGKMFNATSKGLEWSGGAPQALHEHREERPEDWKAWGDTGASKGVQTASDAQALTYDGGHEHAPDSQGAQGACSTHGFDLRFCRSALALMEEMVWDIFEAFGHGSPERAELEREYDCFLSQPAGAKGLRIGIGHETMDT